MNMAEAESRFRVSDWMPIAAVVLSLSVGGLTGWIMKIDNRVFDMNSKMVVHQDLKDLRREMLDATALTRREVAAIKGELRQDLKGMEERLSARISSLKEITNAR